MKKWFFIGIIIFTNILHGQSIFTMQNGHFRICDGKVTDSDNGKTKGTYDHNENYTFTLSIPGASKISLKFNSFCTEKDNDILRIFDGKDTNATLLGKYSGSNNPGTVSSSDSFITLHFISDKSVSCSGWEAELIRKIVPPKAVVLTLKNVVKCSDSIITIVLDQAIDRDSMNLTNTEISNLQLWKILPQNVSNNKSNQFEFHIKNMIQNGSFTVNHKHGYRDFCDSIYWLKSSRSFKITDCPIEVALTNSIDTICLGGCAKITAKIKGGDSSKYLLSWSPNLPKTKDQSVCPKKDTWYKLTVSDGVSIPGTDSILIKVLAPPSAQNDTSVCYYSNNFKLFANPSGGKWYGKGILNSHTGEFKPLGNYGVNKVWYQIGDCADTVIVSVLIPYNYDNVFCPSKTAYSVYWFGPADGVWSGPKINPAGLFLPDSIGVYTVTYSWKGCIANKKITVQNISVPQFDTTCESSVRDTLNFSPLGLIPSYFVGLQNSYYGWYNPSLMGGPGNKNIIFQGRGTCRDTTLLTVLPCFAGKDDTLCPDPNQTSFITLSGFRSSNDYQWFGKGIVDSYKGTYNSNWSNGKAAVDTVFIKSKGCIDQKLVYIMNNELNPKDTFNICPEIDSISLFSHFSPNILNGNWSFPASNSGIIKVREKISTGIHTLEYSAKGCVTSVKINVLPAPKFNSDSSICRNIDTFSFEYRESGFYTGKGVSTTHPQKVNQKFLNIGINVFQFENIYGCKDTMFLNVDTLQKIDFTQFTPFYCYKNEWIDLIAYPKGGQFYWNGLLDSGLKVKPMNLGVGNHKFVYIFHPNSCVNIDSTYLKVSDSIRVEIDPLSDSVCLGTTVLYSAQAFGGIGNYKYSWSHGQFGNKTYLTPISNTLLTLTVSDGCSEDASVQISVNVHPKVWFELILSDPLCYGKLGFVLPKLGNGNLGIWKLSPTGIFKNDTIFASVGNRYKLFVTDINTGCYSDTSIEIPGFPGINASFSVKQPQVGNCFTPVDGNVQVFDNSLGGTSGSWYLNGNYIANYIPFNNLNVLIDSGSQHFLSMIIQNNGGCVDSFTKEICFKDTVFFIIPTAFTPNNDGLNDVFNWNVIGGKEVNVLIFNRWGQQVFVSNELNGFWDGTFDHQECQEGLYSVVIRYRSNQSAARIKSHSVYLIRPRSK